MERLNLPTYSFRIKSSGGRKLIFDQVRKKFVTLTPEEWVRQNFIQYLVREKDVPASLILVEKQFSYNRLTKRSDILVYNRRMEPVLMVECKSPDILINQQAFHQIALYNLKFRVPFLVVSNGSEHYCCKLDPDKNGYLFIKEIPGWDLLNA